jgi:hypothetical protein
VFREKTLQKIRYTFIVENSFSQNTVPLFFPQMPSADMLGGLKLFYENPFSSFLRKPICIGKRNHNSPEQQLPPPPERHVYPWVPTEQDLSHPRQVGPACQTIRRHVSEPWPT